MFPFLKKYPIFPFLFFISNFQLPLIIPITFFIISAFLIVVPCYAEPYQVGMGVLITVAGIPVYLFGVVWQNKPTSVQNSIGEIIQLYVSSYKYFYLTNLFCFHFTQLQQA